MWLVRRITHLAIPRSDNSILQPQFCNLPAKEVDN
ncbi:hypothetical protein GJV44_00330 [Candidatus Vallotia cooleyia]|nr:hypothetical protein GJV44_00330 [Candidatus Vallotia cooleyia]